MYKPSYGGKRPSSSKTLPACWKWRRVLAAAGLLAVLAISAGAATPWQRFSSPAGRFSVSFPGVPVSRSSDMKTALGPVKLHTFAVESHSMAYIIIYADYPLSLSSPAQSRGILDAAASGAATGDGAKLLRQTTGTYDGYPDRDLTISKSGGRFIVRDRIILAKRRLYQLIQVSPQKQASSTAIQVFLNSFELLG